MTALSYLHALPSAVIATDRALAVQFLNPAAEMLLGVSAAQAVGKKLAALPAMDEEISGLCERVLESGEEISLFGHELLLPFNHQTVALHITPVGTEPQQLLMTIDKPGGLDRMRANEWKQEATRAAGVMAAMLAHEVKNPLSGIRGAAQLLKDEVPPEHQALTELICQETDRIRDLLALVEVFEDGVPERQPVNIHEVLQYVIGVARAGFAGHTVFRELYDPSLPLVMGHRDLLVQLFLNLVKNAAEAMEGQADGVITIGTAYRGFSRMRLSALSHRERGGQNYNFGRGEGTSPLTGPHPNPLPEGEGINRVALPIAVSIEDNGSGIAESVRPHLFEPFISSKQEGRGLGLAIVAKIASDLGAVVELDKDFTSGTRFTVWLGPAE